MQHTLLRELGIMATEADTCRKFVVPKLQAAGWDTDPHLCVESPCAAVERNRIKPVLRF